MDKPSIKNMETYLREEFESRPIRSEGLEIEKLENKHVAIIENDEEGFELILDGSHGLARSSWGELVYVPIRVKIEDSDKFAGVVALKQDDTIPYIGSQDRELLMVSGVIKPASCRKEHFTAEGWKQYKSEVHKQKALYASASAIGLTALGLTAGTLWYRKHKS